MLLRSSVPTSPRPPFELLRAWTTGARPRVAGRAAFFSARSTGQTVGWVLAAFKEWDGGSLPDEVVGGKLSEAKMMSTAFKQN